MCQEQGQGYIPDSTKHDSMCLGKKEKVGVGNLDGEKEYHQKRLVLCNLKELYSNFKKENPGIKIGFSPFAALRPKWCVLSGSSGTHPVCVFLYVDTFCMWTHSVCVCTYHHNPKLMIDASLKNSNINELMTKCVCQIENKN